MEEAGTIIINAKISAEDVETELKRLKKQMETFEKEATKLSNQKLKLEAEIELKGKDYERKIEEINKRAQIKIDSYEGGDTISRAARAREIQAKAQNEIDILTQRYNDYLEQADNTLSSIENKLELNQKAQGQLNNDIQITTEKFNRLQNTENLGLKFDNIKNSINGIGNSIEGVIKKVTRWGLAIFGIRSAYLFVRQEMSVLSGYNKQIGTDLQYIRFAVATALQKIIENIIKLVYKLLQYINYIAKAWFGVNLFANASTKAFEKTNKGVKATNKSAKELQKTIAGFDEMNILQKDGSVGAGGGGGGVTAPSVDLSNWENVSIPKWIQWIADNKDLVLGFFEQLAAIILTIKFVEFLNGISGVFIILQGLQGLALWGMLGGIVITLYGIYETIMGLIGWLKDPTWTTFIPVLEGIATAFVGISIAMIAVNASNPLGWIMLAISAIVTLSTKIKGFIEKLKGEEDQSKKTKDAINQLKEAKEKLKTATNNYVSAVDNAESAERKLNETEKKHKISGQELFKQVQNGTLDYKNMNSAQREVYKAYLENKDAQDNLKKTTKELQKANKEEAEASINKQWQLAKESGEYSKLKETMTDAYNSGKISAEEFAAYVATTMRDTNDYIRAEFVEGLPQEILQVLDTSRYGKAFADFENWWKRSTKKLNTKIELEFSYRASAGGGKGGGGGSGGGFAKGGIAYFTQGYKLPRLASGGIINQPGRGVPIMSAIGGERRAEGVIPLTDSQQMALLGEAIGKYITINANIVNTMNGRVISREMQKINNESEFAFNN